MEELWYEKEKKLKERKLFADDILVRTEDELFDSPDKWEFVSNLKKLKIVIEPSTRTIDSTSGVSTLHPGRYVEFRMGRFVTDDPGMVDFLLSKPECGSMFIPGFNIDDYKKQRRIALGLEEVDETASVTRKERPRLNLPSRNLETRELSVEERKAFDSDSDLSKYIGSTDEKESEVESESAIVMPDPQEMQRVLSTPYKPNPNERVDKMEDRLDKIENLLMNIAEKFQEPEPIPAGVEEMEDVKEAFVVGDGRFKCTKCGAIGFDSPNAVTQHRKSGECNRFLARKLASEGLVRPVTVRTGMTTAG